MMDLKVVFRSAILLSLLTILFSCNTDELESKIAELEKEKIEASNELGKQGEIIMEFVGSMNEIEENLSKIKVQEDIMATRFKGRDVELDNPMKSRIISDIDLINNLLKENKEKMATLNAKLKKSKSTSKIKINELEKMVEGLAIRIQEKDAEIEGLRVKLAEANAQLKVLFEEYNFRLEEIGDQEDKLNTAYYCFGSSKELKERGVITKKGGFIGIGKTSKLSEDFNKEYFTEVNISLVTEIPLLSKEAEIVTNHPSESYELSADKLVIKDAAEFWSASKFLVIVVK